MPRNVGFVDRPRFQGDTRGRRIEESREAEWNKIQQRNMQRPELVYLGGRHRVESEGAFDMDPCFRGDDDDRSSIGNSTETSYATPRHQHHERGPPHDGYYLHDSPNQYPGPRYYDRLPP